MFFSKQKLLTVIVVAVGATAAGLTDFPHRNAAAQQEPDQGAARRLARATDSKEVDVGLEVNEALDQGEWVSELAWSSDARTVVCKIDRGKRDRTTVSGQRFKLVDAEKAVVRQTLPKSAVVLVLSPDGKLLAGTESTEDFGVVAVKVWDARSGKEKCVLTETEAQPVLIFSPDCKTLMAGSTKSRVELWDVTTGIRTADFGKPHGGITFASFLPDGKGLVTSCRDGNLRLYDIWKATQSWAIPGDGPFVVSADGRRMVLLDSKEAEANLKLHDLETGKLVRAFELKKGWSMPGGFSPDGSLLVSFDVPNDSVVRLWDTATGKEVQSLHAHMARVYSAAFSPDGKILATGGADRTIRLWTMK